MCVWWWVVECRVKVSSRGRLQEVKGAVPCRPTNCCCVRVHARTAQPQREMPSTQPPPFHPSTHVLDCRQGELLLCETQAHARSRVERAGRAQTRLARGSGCPQPPAALQYGQVQLHGWLGWAGLVWLLCASGWPLQRGDL